MVYKTPLGLHQQNRLYGDSGVQTTKTKTKGEKTTCSEVHSIQTPVGLRCIRNIQTKTCSL